MMKKSSLSLCFGYLHQLSKNQHLSVSTEMTLTYALTLRGYMGKSLLNHLTLVSELSWDGAGFSGN